MEDHLASAHTEDSCCLQTQQKTVCITEKETVCDQRSHCKLIRKSSWSNKVCWRARFNSALVIPFFIHCLTLMDRGEVSVRCLFDELCIGQRRLWSRAPPQHMRWRPFSEALTLIFTSHKPSSNTVTALCLNEHNISKNIKDRVLTAAALDLASSPQEVLQVKLS